MKPKVQRLIDLRDRSTIRTLPPPDEPKDDPPFLPLYEAAKRMGIGLKTLQALTEDGTIFSIPVGVTGKYRKVPVGEIEKWRQGNYGTARQSDRLRNI